MLNNASLLMMLGGGLKSEIRKKYPDSNFAFIPDSQWLADSLYNSPNYEGTYLDIANSKGKVLFDDIFSLNGLSITRIVVEGGPSCLMRVYFKRTNSNNLHIKSITIYEFNYNGNERTYSADCGSSAPDFDNIANSNGEYCCTFFTYDALQPPYFYKDVFCMKITLGEYSSGTTIPDLDVPL